MTAVAVLCGLAAVGLTVVALTVDLDTADRAASVIGTVVGLAGLVVSLFSLHRAKAGSPVESGGARSVAAGRNIAQAVTGDPRRGARPVGPTAVPASPVPSGDAGGGPAGPVRAPGERSVAAGDSIGGADSGDEGGVG
ncbi:hypothetical protein RM550_16295 [Streptomyces sp. DSM 41527]|uniref:Uncharacterized protein n=1 Tax=Streptomyces mooreae TaxID=3075523 RepID=A0ABU2T8M6_9ACTN|nr:hypothetical protein [Streptomyces sp. DSM 41527]MDT0457281.1 hypothetical protein [Streptomyces sp. DSM 41527]